MLCLFSDDEEAVMKRGYVFIALATLFFSTMEIALKGVAGQFNPVQLNLTRFCIGGLVLIPFARRMLHRRGVRLEASALCRFALLAFLGIVVSMTLYQLAVENTNASVVAVLFSCNPVFVLVFAALILRTRIRGHHTLALVLECLGILILINPFNTHIGIMGIFFTLLSTATFALYTVLGTKLCARYSGVVVTCCSFLFGAPRRPESSPGHCGRARKDGPRPFRGYPSLQRLYARQLGHDALYLRGCYRCGFRLLFHGNGSHFSHYGLTGLFLQACAGPAFGVPFPARGHPLQHGCGHPAYFGGIAGFLDSRPVYGPHAYGRPCMGMEAQPGVTFRFLLLRGRRPKEKVLLGVFCGLLND